MGGERVVEVGDRGHRGARMIAHQGHIILHWRLGVGVGGGGGWSGSRRGSRRERRGVVDCEGTALVVWLEVLEHFQADACRSTTTDWDPALCPL